MPTMTRNLPLSLLSTTALSVLAIASLTNPTITPPAILPRQADSNFIGWVSYNHSWHSQTCVPGLTWYQRGSYARCCPDTLTRCLIPTACVRGSQIYPLATATITTACTDNYNDTAASVCNTAFIYESFGDPSPKTDIICGESSVNWSFYRNVPATVTGTPSSTCGPSSTYNSLYHYCSPIYDDYYRYYPEPSKAWIAGAVVGPIVGIALIAAIILFLIRRKKSKKARQTTIIPQTGGATMGPTPGVTPCSDPKTQMAQNTTSHYYGQPSPELGNPYNQQQGFPQSPGSPAPQYSATGSPPPQGAFAQDVEFGYNASSHPEAAELGVVSSAAGPSVPGQMHTAAELGGVSSAARPSVPGQLHTAELSGSQVRN